MVTFEQRLRGGMPCGYLDVGTPGRGDSKCKGPEVRTPLVRPRISRKVTVERRRGAW